MFSGAPSKYTRSERARTHRCRQCSFQEGGYGHLQDTSINPEGILCRPGILRTQRPKLHEEQMWPHVLPTRQDQLRLYDAMRRRLSKTPNPPLRTRQRRRIDLELLSFGNESRGGFESGDVTAVTELGLEITA